MEFLLMKVELNMARYWNEISRERPTHKVNCTRTSKPAEGGLNQKRLFFFFLAVTKILTDVNLLKTEPQADHNKHLVLATPEAQVVGHVTLWTFYKPF